MIPNFCFANLVPSPRLLGQQFFAGRDAGGLDWNFLSVRAGTRTEEIKIDQRPTAE